MKISTENIFSVELDLIHVWGNGVLVFPTCSQHVIFHIKQSTVQFYRDGPIKGLFSPAPRFGPYYIEPVIAGLDPKTFEPFICSLDLIGCPMVTEDFVVNGTCSEQMYGMCESLWEPDMVRCERVYCMA